MTTPPPLPPSSDPRSAPGPSSAAGGVDAEADRMLLAVRAGSNRAWAALLSHLDPRARRLAHLVLGGQDVDQALLAAYIRAYRARRKGSDDAVVFLLNHVWTACGHEIRRRQRRVSPAPGRRAGPVEDPPLLGDEPLGRAVAALRPEERAIWVLVEREELPAGVVSDALGVGPQVVTAVAERVRGRVDDALTVATEPATEDLDAPAGPVEADADADADVDAESSGAGDLEPEPAGAAFWAELGRRLRDEREALPAAPPPRLPAPGDPSPALTPAKAPPVAMQKRAPRRSRRSRPDLVENLAEEADRQRERRSVAAGALRVAAVVVPLVLLAGVIAVLYRAATTAKAPVRGTSTAAIAGRSLDQLASPEGWTATVVRTARGLDGTSSEVTMAVSVAADGSYRVEEQGGTRLVTYDAGTGLLQDHIPGFGLRHEAGVAPGPPDPSAPRTELPMGDLARAARSLATETDTEPTRTTVDDVEVWRLSKSLGDGLRLTYTVRIADLMPHRLTWSRKGETERDLLFAAVLPGTQGAVFSQELPPDAPPPTTVGFVPVQIGEIASRIGLAPLTPDYLPTGFVISGTWIHPEARIIALRYARGPAQITITLRPSPVEAGQPWDDPFDRGLVEVGPESVEVGRGPFRDVGAQVVTDEGALPSVWGADGERAFTVAGDLSRDELLDVARSLG